MFLLLLFLINIKLILQFFSFMTIKQLPRFVKLCEVFRLPIHPSTQFPLLLPVQAHCNDQEAVMSTGLVQIKTISIGPVNAGQPVGPNFDTTSEDFPHPVGPSTERCSLPHILRRRTTRIYQRAQTLVRSKTFSTTSRPFSLLSHF